MERRDEVAPVQTERGEESVETDGRVNITIIARRRRLLDPDNVCAKFAIDALRYAGLLADDNPKHVAGLTIRQEKVAKGEDPETIVEVYWNVTH